MDAVPLQITTNKDRLLKTVEIDGYAYKVRRPGAGESLTYRQLGREMTKLEAKKKLNKAEEEKYEEMRARSNRLSLDLFDSLGNSKAKSYIDSLPLQILLETIGEIFGEADIDEPGQAEPAPTDG